MGGQVNFDATPDAEADGPVVDDRGFDRLFERLIDACDDDAVPHGSRVELLFDAGEALHRCRRMAATASPCELADALSETIETLATEDDTQAALAESALACLLDLPADAFAGGATGAELRVALERALSLVPAYHERPRLGVNIARAGVRLGDPFAAVAHARHAVDLGLDPAELSSFGELEQLLEHPDYVALFGRRTAHALRSALEQGNRTALEEHDRSGGAFDEVQLDADHEPANGLLLIAQACAAQRVAVGESALDRAARLGCIRQLRLLTASTSGRLRRAS